MKKHVITAIVAVAIAGVGFAGGVTYAKSKPAASSTGAGQYARTGGAGTQGRTRGANASGGFVVGQVLSSDANSITVSTMGGGSKIVFLSDKTEILKTTAGSVTDLTPNTNVVVMGTAGSDGSVTATSIQIRPAGMQMPSFGGGARGGTTPTPQQ